MAQPWVPAPGVVATGHIHGNGFDLGSKYPNLRCTFSTTTKNLKKMWVTCLIFFITILIELVWKSGNSHKPVFFMEDYFQ